VARCGYLLSYLFAFCRCKVKQRKTICIVALEVVQTVLTESLTFRSHV